MPGPRASVAVDSARASIGWRIWVFFLLLAGVVLVTDHLVSLGLRKAKTNDCGIMNRVVAGRINASIIISGSSRALHHYDPAIIQSISGHSAFNLGLNASHIDVQLALLKTYLRHNQQPDVIIQNLDDFTFGVTREQDFRYAALFKPYLDEPSIYSALRSIRPDAWKQRYIPLYTYGTQDMDFSWMIGLRALLGNNLREKRLDGYLPERLSWNDDFDRFKALNPNGVEMAVEERGVALVKEPLTSVRESELCWSSFILRSTTRWDGTLRIGPSFSTNFESWRSRKMSGFGTTAPALCARIRVTFTTRCI